MKITGRVLRALFVAALLASVLSSCLNEQLTGALSFSSYREITVTAILLAGVIAVLALAYIRNHKTKKVAEEAHNRARLILDSLPIACCLFGRDYRSIDCNSELLRLFKIKSKESIINMPCDMLLPKYQPDGRVSSEVAFAVIDMAFKEGKHVLEAEFRLLDGTPLPALVTLERIAYDGGYVILSSIQDLREHKKMMADIAYRDRLMLAVNRAAAILLNSDVNYFELTLYQSMEMVARIVDVDCVYVCENRIIDGELYCSKLIEWSSTATSFMDGSLCRYSESMPGWEKILSGGNCINGLVNDMSPEAQAHLSGTESVLAVPIYAEETFWGFVGFGDRRRERLFTEEEISGLRSASLLFFNAFRHNRVLINILDTSAELKRMTNRVETIINNLPGMVFQHLYNPPEYTYTFVSAGSKELLGYMPEEMIGQSSLRMLMAHSHDISKIDSLSSKTLAKGLPFETMYQVKTHGGQEKWLWERSRVIEYNPDGTPYLIEGYHTDITERHQLEAAEAANRAKSDFLAVMSHEIRTPMNSILGFAELSQDIATAPQVKEYLRRITESAKWLLNIINDILDVSKIESGKMELDSAPFDLSDVIARCQSVILPDVKDKMLELKIYAEKSTGKKLIGDPVRLYQVLLNLLSNAVKFTDSGTIKLTAAVKSSGVDSTTVYFEVSDTGIGMDSGQIARMFEPFIQADSGTTRNYGGTGLGLAISKNIVELMGGQLSVKSSLGKGSTFSFEIIFKTTDAVEANGINCKSHAQTGIIEKPHFEGLVLICDDNYMNQRVICDHLKRVGLKTILADDGKIGVEKVRERQQNGEPPFDLIFMDIFMPVMDGLEAVKIINGLNTGTPIVAMTANIMAGELEKYRKHGMPDCLSKPFTSQELWRILLNYLKPVSNKFVDESEQPQDIKEMQHLLRVDFIKNNKSRYDELTEAVAAGDLKLAHRLVHSLKSNAGFIGQSALQEIAANIENLFASGEPVPEFMMDLLESELTAVIDELGPVTERRGLKILDAAQTAALFAKLEPMLENIDPDCIELIDEVRAVPGADELAERIENFDLSAARDMLAALKKKLNLH